MNEPQQIYGILYLLPVGLGDDDVVIPEYNKHITSTLNEFIVENIRTARRFLRSTGYTQDFENVIFHIMDKHTSDSDIPVFLQNLKKGHSIGLLSEAGNPCIADPGNKVVKLAHAAGIRVRPLVGPSSILMALISSGFNGQHFAFSGYLPVDKKERQTKIKELQQLAIQKNQTQIFMETPFRNNALLEDVLTICHETMLLCIATNISTETESINTKSIREWKKKTPDLHKKPSVFLLYKDVF
jgi:16S rRNA (cytidine1402-2'-O)-methyltransferase